MSRTQASEGLPSAGPIAVIGGSGFLGAHAVAAARAASEPGRAVLAISREPGPAPEGVRALAADALSPGELEVALQSERPARVLLCAALARGADCERTPVLARQLNAELPERVATWCAAHGARLVLVSTDLVFGAEAPPPGGFDEACAPAPLGVYGASKAEGERRLLAADPAALVVRLPLLYGDSGGRGLGASDALLEAVARGEVPELFEDEWRTPLEVASAARALVELLERDAPRGVLHVAGPERVERHALGLAVLRSAGHARARAETLVRATTRAAAGLEASRPRDVSLDCAAARGLLTTPLPDLETGLRRARA